MIANTVGNNMAWLPSDLSVVPSTPSFFCEQLSTPFFLQAGARRDKFINI
jgi:hypothetical protein